MNAGATSLATRQLLATQVFAATSAYDNDIYNWLYRQIASPAADDPAAAAASLATRDLAELLFLGEKPQPFMVDGRLFLLKSQDLRYGENPQQQAAFYHFRPEAGRLADLEDPSVINPSWQLASARQLQGKQLSYNNYLDLDAAWAAVREFNQPCSAIVKHTTPCGIASASDLVQAYQQAFACDPVSAFGGVMAFNRRLTVEVVQAIYANEQFIEALVVPEIDAAALALLAEKPNVRVLSTGGLNPPGGSIEYRSVDGGLLAMTADCVCESPREFKVASLRQPTAAELESLYFAWKACKSVKSNAIVIARGSATVGIGAGQPNRVNSARLAVQQAGDKALGAVAASDAFMPFADSLEVLAQAGVSAVIQPGGSIRDAEVLTAANDADMAVVFTGYRHFRH